MMAIPLLYSLGSEASRLRPHVITVQLLFGMGSVVTAQDIGRFFNLESEASRLRSREMGLKSLLLLEIVDTILRSKVLRILILI